MDRLVSFLGFVYSTVVIPAAEVPDRQRLADGRYDAEAQNPRAVDNAITIRATLRRAGTSSAPDGITAQELENMYGAAWSLLGDFWSSIVGDVRAVFGRVLTHSAADRQNAALHR